MHDILPQKWMCSESRDLSKFWQISDNTSETPDKLLTPTVFPPPYTTRTYIAHAYQFPFSLWVGALDRYQKNSALESRVGWTPSLKERTNERRHIISRFHAPKIVKIGYVLTELFKNWKGGQLFGTQCRVVIKWPTTPETCRYKKLRCFVKWRQHSEGAAIVMWLMKSNMIINNNNSFSVVITRLRCGGHSTITLL